jgi:hypothetical protein
MPDEDEGGRSWIVEPPPTTDEITLYVAMGDGVELTSEQEEALGALLRSLESGDSEVAGFDIKDPCPGLACKLKSCIELSCGKVNCSKLTCGKLTKAAQAGSAGWNLSASFGSIG